MAWCARIYIWNEDDQSNSPQNSLHVHDWLGMIPEEAKLTFSNSRRQLTSDAHELEEVTSFNRTYASWSGHEGNAYKVSNTTVMFNVNHGGDKMPLMGSTTTHRNLHITGLPPSCEHGDSIGQTKRCNGVHMMVEVQWYGNSDELLLSPSTTFCLLPDSCWTSI